MEVTTIVPLTAQMIDGHYKELDGEKKYPVEEIVMGQSSTIFTLENKKGAYNTVHFKFYVDNREVDIYRSALLNPYISFNTNPAIFFNESSRENTMVQGELDKLNTIVETYGAGKQEDMAIEECSELIKAILKYRRECCKTPSDYEEAIVFAAEKKQLRAAVIDEIADVSIMVAQLQIIFGCMGEVEERIDYKIDRQINRIEEREGHTNVCEVAGRNDSSE